MIYLLTEGNYMKISFGPSSIFKTFELKFERDVLLVNSAVYNILKNMGYDYKEFLNQTIQEHYKIWFDGIINKSLYLDDFPTIVIDHKICGNKISGHELIAIVEIPKGWDKSIFEMDLLSIEQEVPSAFTHPKNLISTMSISTTSISTKIYCRVFVQRAEEFHL